jgi:hypothetical protein
MVGILVYGDNHFILSGPPPDENAARAMARHFSIVQIGAAPSFEFGEWRIRTKEFRENLEWAVVIPDARNASTAVARLLEELVGRGVRIQRYDSRPG